MHLASGMDTAYPASHSAAQRMALGYSKASGCALAAQLRGLQIPPSLQVPG